MVSPSVDALGSLAPCRACGFGVDKGAQHCPECGIHQSPSSPGTGSPVCHQQIARHAQKTLERVQQELDRFETQHRAATERIEEARSRGRNVAALQEAVHLIHGARDSRARLAATCHSILDDIDLERIENTLDLVDAGHEPRFPVFPEPVRWNAPYRDRVLRDHTAQISALCVSPDGQWLLSAGKDATLRVWRRTNNSCARVIPTESPIASLAFTPDGRHVASAGTNGAVRLWDASTWSPATQLGFHPGGAFAVALSPNGSLLASAGKDGVIRLWHPHKRKEIAALKDPGETILSLAFSPNGSLIASGSWNGTLRLWSVGRKTQQGSIAGHNSGVMALSFSPGGQWLASASWDTTIRLWNLSNQRDVAVLTGHRLGALSAAFSPDGRWLAAGAGDHQLRIWDVEAREQASCLPTSEGAILAVAFAPDGGELYCAGGDHGIHVWRPHVVPPAVLQRVGAIAAREGDRGFLRVTGGPAVVFRAQAVFGRLLRWAGDSVVAKALQRARHAEGIPDTEDLSACLRELAGQLESMNPGPTFVESVTTQRSWLLDVCTHLPVLVLRDQVRSLLDGVEAQILSLGTATEEECDERLARLEGLQKRAEQLQDRLQSWSQGPPSGPWMDEVRGALHAVLDQIPSVSDLAFLRKTTVLVTSVAPIADEAPLAEIRRQQQRLRADRGLMAFDPSAPSGPPREARSDPSESIQVSAQVVAEATDRHAVVSSQLEALAEVDELLRSWVGNSPVS